MSSDPVVVAGVDVSSGRKPVTFAALDSGLNVLVLQKCTISDFVGCLKEYETILLAITGTSVSVAEVKKSVGQVGIKPISRGGSRRWMETDAQKCFEMLCKHELLSRRTLEGRIQRALLLYEEGLKIPDPMDFFEEITRHKLIQGSLPLENTYSVRELDAMSAAYLSWMFINDPGQVRIDGNQSIPVQQP